MNRSQELIEERQKTHGDYKKTAAIAQDIKAMLSAGSRMQADQKESLDNIATKLARIVSGSPHVLEHWEDIAGYATLVADRLRGEKAVPVGIADTLYPPPPRPKMYPPAQKSSLDKLREMAEGEDK